MEYVLFILLIILLGFVYYFYRRASHGKKRLIDILFLWAIFGVIFALSPIFFNMLAMLLQGNQIIIPGLLSNGELLLISTAIAADAAGRLLSTPKDTDRILRSMAASGILLILFFAALLYAYISSATAGTFSAERITRFSTFIFFITIVTSVFCLILSEWEKEEIVSG